MTHPVCIHATAFLFLLLVVSSWNNGFVHGFVRLAVTTTSLTQDPWIPRFTNGPTLHRAMADESSAKNSDDNDDGWGDGEDDDDDVASLSNKSQLQELQALQQEPQRSTTTTNNNVAAEPPERDLFIPVFALVSLAGLFGAYGYEMLRLYSRGELYLPWNN